MIMKDYSSPWKKWLVNRLLLAVGGLMLFFGLVDTYFIGGVTGTMYIGTGILLFILFLISFWLFWLKKK